MNSIQPLTIEAMGEARYLKLICSRLFIPIPGPNPTAADVIPGLLQVMANHDKHEARTCGPWSGDYTEWKETYDYLQALLAQLQALATPPPAPKSQIPATHFPAPPQPPAPNSSLSVSSVTSASSVLIPKPIPQPTASASPNALEPSKRPRHFHVSNQPTPKSPAISTLPVEDPKTFGHFHDSPHKNSPPPENADRTPPKKSPRIAPLLSTLSPEQVETLIALCEETPSYRDASVQAREKLGLKISPSSLCKLYTRHRIAEDSDAREEYLAQSSSGESAIIDLAKDQLQLRLLELASRPNPGASELRALFQIITRLQALSLSERRVVVAEKREARMEQAEALRNPQQPQEPITDESMTRWVKLLLGKEITMGDELIGNPTTIHQPHNVTTVQRLKTTHGAALLNSSDASTV